MQGSYSSLWREGSGQSEGRGTRSQSGESIRAEENEHGKKSRSFSR